MLTFVSGWRSQDRDHVIVAHQDSTRPAVYFIDEASHLPDDFPDAPIIDLYRNGYNRFEITDDRIQIVRLNYDTDNALIIPAVSRVLQTETEAQIVVMYDATEKLRRFYPSLRDYSALLASDSRLNASEGDHVIFTHGGSFVWKDRLLETQTAALVGDEELDIGVVNEALTEFDY